MCYVYSNDHMFSIYLCEVHHQQNLTLLASVLISTFFFFWIGFCASWGAKPHVALLVLKIHPVCIMLCPWVLTLLDSAPTASVAATQLEVGFWAGASHL